MTHRATTRGAAARPPAEPLDGAPDGALVVAARAGSRAAMQALFRRHFKAAHGLAFTLLGDSRELDDLVQESMLSALRSLPKLRDPDAFRPWLAQHVVHHSRRHFRRLGLLARLGIVSQPTSDFEHLVAPGVPPDVAAELRDLYRRVERLRPRERIALLLRHVEGLELTEVAEALAASLTSVKRWISDGERQLRKDMRRAR